MSTLRIDEDLLERMVRAVEKVRERLHRAVKALEEAKIPYAVIGGHGVAAWVATVDESTVRNTPDVDILVRRPDFDLAQVALSRAGFVRRDIDEIATFLDGPTAKARDAVHIFFAGEKVRPGDLLPAPEVSGSETTLAYRVLALESLVAMKLTSFRLKDRVHLRDLIDVGLVDETWLSRLPAELAPRLKELLDNPKG